MADDLYSRLAAAQGCLRALFSNLHAPALLLLLWRWACLSLRLHPKPSQCAYEGALYWAAKKDKATVKSTSYLGGARLPPVLSLSHHTSTGTLGRKWILLHVLPCPATGDQRHSGVVRAVSPGLATQNTPALQVLHSLKRCPPAPCPSTSTQPEAHSVAPRQPQRQWPRTGPAKVRLEARGSFITP